MTEITPCRHDGESVISLIERLGYSEEDLLLCKLCQKEEIEQLEARIRSMQHNLDYKDEQLESIQKVLGVTICKIVYPQLQFVEDQGNG